MLNAGLLKNFTMLKFVIETAVQKNNIIGSTKKKKKERGQILTFNTFDKLGHL